MIRIILVQKSIKVWWKRLDNKDFPVLLLKFITVSSNML